MGCSRARGGEEVTQKLLPLAHNVTLVRLGSRNASSTIRHLRDLLVHIDPSYPGIEKWLDTKVIAHLADDSRRAYLVYQDQRPIASAIAKKGEAAKLCNLRIGPEWKERKLGTLLISLLALSTAEYAESMYFTVPESIWSSTRSFFQGFGFEARGPADKQYRLWDNELACSAPMALVLKAVRQKLPPVLAGYCMNGVNADSSLVLSVKPQFANSILEGRKTVEIRKQFSPRWRNSKSLIYASAPDASVVGECLIDDVDVGSPHVIWARYHDRMACSRLEFADYCGQRPLISALLLKDVRAFQHPLKRSRMEEILGAALHPPQSYARVTEQSHWLAAASLGSLLQV